jgi:hypothetical protein
MTASSGVLDSDSIALGPQPSEVAAVAILVHGRSHSPNEMCDLAVGLANPSICFVMPAVRGGTWYPDIVLCGFSQGACLTVEFLIRNPRPYGAVLIFTVALSVRPERDGRCSPALKGPPVYRTGSVADEWGDPRNVSKRRADCFVPMVRA